MTRTRIYALARDTGVPINDVLRRLRLWGFDVHRPQSWIDGDAAGDLRKRLKEAPPPSGPVDRKTEKLGQRTIYVDGSNIAFVGKQARIAVLKSIRLALKLEGADPARIHIICDATLRHRLGETSTRDVEEFEKAIGTLWHQVPAGSSADQHILIRLKAEPGALVVSNDTFKKEKQDGIAPPDIDERRLSAFVMNETLTLNFPRTWELAPSEVVRLQ